MSLIQPFSDTSAYASGGKWAPTSTNFPSLKLFVPCLQSEIGGSLGDTIGGLFFANLGTIAAPAAPDGYSVFPNLAADTSLHVTGTLPVIGTKNFVFFSVAQATTNGVAIGRVTATSSGGISLGSALTTSAFDGTNTFNMSAGGAFTSNAGTTIYGRAIAVDWSGNATAYECTASANTKKNDVAMAVLTGITTLRNTWSCGSNVTNLYGFGLCVFTGALPSQANIGSMLAWVTGHLSTNDPTTNGVNKTFYPGWDAASGIV